MCQLLSPNRRFKITKDFLYGCNLEPDLDPNGSFLGVELWQLVLKVEIVLRLILRLPLRPVSSEPCPSPYFFFLPNDRAQYLFVRNVTPWGRVGILKASPQMIRSLKGPSITGSDLKPTLPPALAPDHCLGLDAIYLREGGEGTDFSFCRRVDGSLR